MDNEAESLGDYPTVVPQALDVAAEPVNLKSAAPLRKQEVDLGSRCTNVRMVVIVEM